MKAVAVSRGLVGPKDQVDMARACELLFTAGFSTASSVSEISGRGVGLDVVRKNIQEREKETLDVMEAIEQYRKAIEEHTEEFAELEKHLKATEEEGNERIKEMEAAISKTEDRRAQLASRVPDKLLRQYERIHKRLGLALVPVVDGSCTGCNIGLQPQMCNLLQRGNKIFTCPNCFRILVYNKVDDPKSGPEEQD